LDYLDEDADRTISGSELEGLEARMKLVDYNGDDVAEVNEICRATTNQRAQVSNGHSLVVRLDKNTDWTSLATTMQSIYGNRNTSSTFSEDALLNASADIAMRIDFKLRLNQQQASGGVTVVSIREGISAGPEAVMASNDALGFDVGGDYIEFAAGQSPDESGERSMVSQIAVGAVIDGNPLLRLIDRDQDARLTLRERQDLRDQLAALDANSDGNVSGDEIPVPIRLAVTLGPHVHQFLSKPTASLHTIAPREATAAPPDWFASMDKNNDGDLSRAEFLGTAEQFRQFDTDGDGLLGTAEAQKLSAGQ
jgi:Ca2+-binding EF-hand superfamily protein